ncbi:MAG: circadian clock protein KaiC [Xanthobacteraceae bacterium]|nr:circadian clock protein KaiC [Xanthobacteraceae bacterium]
MTQTTPAPGTCSKVATGIAGFDIMTGGGLPTGRASAAIGTAGAGKTVFAMQTLVHRVRETGSVGVFVSFEQSVEGVISDMTSFDWNARALIESGKILVVDGRPQPDILHSGAFDIVGLLATVRGATEPGPPACVVFDGLDTLLTMLPSPNAQRGELLRLQDFVERLGSTIILTIKATLGSNTGFEEMGLYMADCVIELTRDAEDALSSRSLRIQKYRSSNHVQGWMPFIMMAQGIEVEAIDARPKAMPVSDERLSTGIDRLDEMLSGGLYRGSSTLLSGAPGTAKTTLGTRFLDAVCRHGERALCICFDESPEEIVRNVNSVGTKLAPHVTSGLLRMHGMVDRSAGPDEFAHEIANQIRLHRPRHVLIDPVSIFTNSLPAQNAVRRLIQLCKREGITVVLTSLIERISGDVESSRSYVSTLCDNWIHLSYVINGGERNRALTIVKSRGTAHSNQVGELLLGNGGISIADVYTEDGAVLMGSLRWQRERANRRAIQIAEDEAMQRQRDVERSVGELARRIADLNSELTARENELEILRGQAVEVERSETARRASMSKRRAFGASSNEDATGAR